MHITGRVEANCSCGRRGYTWWVYGPSSTNFVAYIIADDDSDSSNSVTSPNDGGMNVQEHMDCVLGHLESIQGHLECIQGYLADMGLEDQPGPSEEEVGVVLHTHTSSHALISFCLLSIALSASLLLRRKLLYADDAMTTLL